MGLKIRFKLLLAFGSILLVSICLILFIISSARSILEYSKLGEQMDQVNIQALSMNGQVKNFYSEGFKKSDFHLTGESTDLLRYRKILGKQDSLIQLLSNHNVLQGYIYIDDLKNSVKEYDNHFVELVKSYKKRGFKDYGVEGELRSAIHSVENAEFDYDRAAMLMRHEKDFFLRKDLKYLDRFNDQIQQFKNKIRQSDSITTKSKILSSIDYYQRQFNSIVDLEKVIGLSSTSGLIGQLSKDYVKIQDDLVLLSNHIKQIKDQLISRSIIIISSLLALQIIGGLILIVLYSRVLSKAVREIRNALVMLSNGSFPDEVKVRTRDEIAQTKIALNQLVNRIKEAVTFSEQLGDGNLDQEYDENFREDVLAKSIIKLQDNLLEINKKQEIVNWTNQGLARFSELLKDDFENLEGLSDRVIKQLVDYTNSNQAAIYVTSDENSIKRIATYAYERKRFVEDTIEVGQGLIGQALLEKDTIYLTDMPDKYTKITSGLGQATPANLLIVPLKVKDEIVGAIELASFRKYETYETKFVEKVSENIANLILTRMNADRTESLLMESQEKANVLTAQEEELRQNAEEMQATQEQIKRNEDESRKVIVELNEKLLNKEKEIATLKRRIENGFIE